MKIMRGVEQIPEDSKELRRDFDRAKVIDHSSCLKILMDNKLADHIQLNR